MISPILVFLLGVVAGGVLFGLILKAKAASMMFIEDRSNRDFEGTLQAIQQEAEANGWKVPKVHRISETIAEAGLEVLPVAVVELCKADIAARVLGDKAGRRVASMMPCRVAVVENENGDVIVSRQDSVRISRIFGGVIQDAMSEAAAQNEELFAPVLSKRR